MSELLAGAGSASLQVENVHKAFGSVPVLRGISVELAPHECVVLIGSSGSGKSTLLRCINGLESIDAGQIWVNGELVSEPGYKGAALRQSVGMVFQQYNLFPHMSVLQNITLAPRKVRSMNKAAAEQRAMQLLERLGLAHKAADYPDRLSGGQQQRVAIARALAMDPQIMMFDEVTSALDPELTGEVLDVLRELRNSGMAMIVATHEMAFAREVSDRVMFLDGGVVVESGSAKQVMDNPQHERTQQFLQRTRTR